MQTFGNSENYISNNFESNRNFSCRLNILEENITGKTGGWGNSSQGGFFFWKRQLKNAAEKKKTLQAPPDQKMAHIKEN